MDIEAILQQLTLSEKVSLCHGQSNFSVAGVPRLDIPALVMSDGPHGVRQELMPDGWEPIGGDNDFITYLPTATAMAATWSVDCAIDFGRVLGEEARARGKDVILGPGVNIHRNALCGRNFEYYTEDPLLAGELAVSVIVAIQEQGTAACVKHFALNSQELRRLSVDARPDERTLQEIYLPAFEAAVKRGKVWSVMGAYNRFRGQHCCHNDYLLNHILKDEWEFDGVAMSDWDGCHDTYEAARCGLDIEMGTSKPFAEYYLARPFEEALAAGNIPECFVDEKVRRVLKLHQRLAERRADLAPAKCNTPEHTAIARKLAEEAIVLLKNDKKVLPLTPGKAKKILVVGANAVTPHHAGGASSAVKAQYEVPPLEGLKRVYGDAAITFELGYPAVLQCAEELELEWQIKCFARQSNTPGATWQQKILHIDWLKDVPAEYRDHLGRVSAEADFTAPVAGEWSFVLYGGIHAVLYSGKEEYNLPPTETASPELPNTLRIPLEAGETIHLWTGYSRHPLKELAPLAMKVIPPGAEAKVDYSALAAKAKAADAVFFFGGQTHAQDFEGADRADLSLRDGQNELIAALAEANRNFAVILSGGSAVTMPWAEKVPAIVQMWYAGSEGGNAIANILSGAVNPSGKLPFTFPLRDADMPQKVLADYDKEACYYREGVFVGYRWYDARQLPVLFPFGHGLSYTEFAYDRLEVKLNPRTGIAARVRCRLTNRGAMAGAEVVQLYVADEECSVERPVRELKGFAKVRLEAGESTTVEFNLTERDLAFFHPLDRRWTVEYGKFTFAVAASSRDLRLTETVIFGA